MQNNFEFITYEEKENIGYLTINREDKLNALSTEVILELRALFESIHLSSVSGVIFTGAGEKAFIAGADIAAMESMTDKDAFEFSSTGQQVTLMMEELHFPIIAAVNGFALGGGLEFALACDFILCSENALFGLPEVSLGLVPGFGGTQRLAKVIGRNRAKEILYTAKKIKAIEAKEIGLALEVLPTKKELIAKCEEILVKVSRNSPHAVGVVKYAINTGVDLSNADGLKVECDQFANVFNSFDKKEGVAAFMEKRKPVFKDE